MMLTNGHSVTAFQLRDETAPHDLRPVHGEASTLIRTLGLLRRRGWLLGLVWAATFAAAVILAAVHPRLYPCETTLEFSPLGLPSTIDPLRAGIATSPVLWENHFKTQESLLRRSGLLQRVLDSLPSDVTAFHRAAKDPVQKLSDMLSIEPIPSTFLIRLTLHHPDPASGCRIVQQLADLFVQDTSLRITELKQTALQVLEKETLPALMAQVKTSERALLDFQEDGGDPAQQNAALLESQKRINDRLSELRLHRIALESETESLKKTTPVAPGILPPLLRSASPTLEGLFSHRAELEMERIRQSAVLKEKHPILIALAEEQQALDVSIAAATREALQQRDRELAALTSEEDRWSMEKAGINVQILQSQLRQAEFRKLEVDAVASRELRDFYLRRQTELRSASGTDTTVVQIVDPPRVDTTPDRTPRLLVTLGAVFGLLAGILAMLVAEQTDDRILSARTAQTALGLNVLSVVPRGSPPLPARGHPFLADDKTDPTLMEAFRFLRIQILSQLEGAPRSKTVAVVSARSGEGRTTVALNLARVLAMEGRRVLLIDCDLRAPKLRGLLGGKNTASMEEYLRGAVSLSSSRWGSRVPGVDVIGAEQPVIGPSELVSSPAFQLLWREARTMYDMIVLDTPPLNTACESLLLADESDASVLVVDAHRSRIHEVHLALNRLAPHSAGLLGIVLNRSSDPGPDQDQGQALRRRPKTAGEPAYGLQDEEPVVVLDDEEELPPNDMERRVDRKGESS